MIVKLKMCTAGNTFSKICVKAIKDTLYMVCYQGRAGVSYEEKGEDPSFLWEWHPTSETGSKLWTWGGRYPTLSFIGKSWSPYKEHPEECA